MWRWIALVTCAVWAAVATALAAQSCALREPQDERAGFVISEPGTYEVNLSLGPWECRPR